MPVVTPQVLATLASRVLREHGAPAGVAQQVALSLVGANLAGHDSHGVMRLPRYVSYLQSGRIMPGAVPVVRRQEGATAELDGRWCFGQLAARDAASLAAEIAEVQGAGVVTLRNVMHIGRVGEYVEALARRGWVSLMLVSNGGPDNAVAPHGGRDRLFGTNPLAFACPGSPGRVALLVDFATAATAEGKLALAREAGSAIEAGVLVDSQGRATRDPAAFYDGGALLPFGGHKGFGVLLMVEVLARIVAGHVPPRSASYTRLPGNTVFVLACDPGRFIGRAAFAREMGKLARAVAQSRPAEMSAAVLMPGAPEKAARAARRRGISVPGPLWAELKTLSSPRCGS